MIEVADHCIFNYLTSLVLIKTLLVISGGFKLVLFISLFFCYHFVLLDAFFVYNRIYNNVNSSGVTTVGGGYSQTPGHADGPTRNASFSYDFELNFIPGSCALIISDHGNKLICQINLKAEDFLQD